MAENDRNLAMKAQRRKLEREREEMEEQERIKAWQKYEDTLKQRYP